MIMREIGSEFWDIPTIEAENDLFPESTQWFLSGRSALQAIIDSIEGAKSVSMPSWCCESMVDPFLKAGIEVHYYPVYHDEGLVQEIDSCSDILFLIDYFGYTSSLPDISAFRGIVIRDVTHSLFSATYSDADFYFGSLRKWCGIWTGGYAWSKAGHKLLAKTIDNTGYTTLRKRAMQLKSSYIHGGEVKNKEYLTVVEEAEDCLDKAGIVLAADRDEELAKRLDIGFLKSRRKTNAKVLFQAFSNWLIFPDPSPTDTPMFVPIFVPDGKRDALRQYLIRNEIYCPVHWPLSGYQRLDDRTEYIYQNELSLVCDQRYEEEDMYRIVETIKAFWKEV